MKKKKTPARDSISHPSIKETHSTAKSKMGKLKNYSQSQQQDLAFLVKLIDLKCKQREEQLEDLIAQREKLELEISIAKNEKYQVDNLITREQMISRMLNDL